jgi:hypothetical protein
VVYFKWFNVLKFKFAIPVCKVWYSLRIIIYFGFIFCVRIILRICIEFIHIYTQHKLPIACSFYTFHHKSVSKAELIEKRLIIRMLHKSRRLIFQLKISIAPSITATWSQQPIGFKQRRPLNNHLLITPDVVITLIAL